MTKNRFIKGFKAGQKEFGETIAIIVNSILLSAVYLVGIGFTSVFSKISGNRFLGLKKYKNKESYWEDSEIIKKDMEDYYKQF